MGLSFYAHPSATNNVRCGYGLGPVGPADLPSVNRDNDVFLETSALCSSFDLSRTILNLYEVIGNLLEKLELIINGLVPFLCGFGEHSLLELQCVCLPSMNLLAFDRLELPD